MRGNTPDNTARNAEIVQRRNDGQLPREIATAMGLSKGAVIGALWRANLCESGANKTTCLKGAEHPRAKLSEVEVEEIRRRHALGERPCDLGRAFGVRHTTILNIVTRRTWGAAA